MNLFFLINSSETWLGL